MSSRDTEEIMLGGVRVEAPREAPGTKDELLKKLRKAIKEKNEDSFHHHLNGLDKLLKDKSRMKELLDGSLAYAAYTGFQSAVETLTKKGADVKAMSVVPEDPEWKGTPLHWAARGGHVDTVIFFLEQGVDVNIENENRYTPLHLAADGGQVDTVRCLVDKGAYTNVRDRSHDMTPLHLAAKAGHADTVSCLVEQGADINAKGHNYNITPLHWAAKGGHLDIVRCLVDNGADTKIEDGNDLTPLQWADGEGHVDTVRYLVDAESLQKLKKLREELPKKLRGAIKKKDKDSFHRHLSGLDEHLQDDKVKELLDDSLAYAAYTGFQPAVETLIQKGAGVNAMSAVPEDPINPEFHVRPDEWKGTPLHWAARGGHVDTVIFFLEHGVDINIRNQQGYTPLHLAADGGCVDTVRCLMDKGAYTNARDSNHDMTPLHLAARAGHVDTVRCLVEHGADINIKGHNYEQTPLHLAAYGGLVDTVRCLVDKGAHTELKDGSDETPLHIACREGHVETVECLLEKGADPTAKARGEIPLSYVIHSRHKDIAAILLEHEKWKEMLRVVDEESINPMRSLIAFMPDVAERVFSKCVTTNKGKHEKPIKEEVLADSRKLKVEFNYEFLEDFQDEQPSDKQSSCEEGGTNIDTSTTSWQPKKFTKYSHTLFLIKKHGCSTLMKHPLVISLLDYKWEKFGQYIFFGNLFIYLIFLVFLTAFGLVVLSPVEKPCTEVLNGSFNGTAPEDCGDLTIDEYRFLFVGAAFTIATALLRLAIELTQLCRHPVEYLQDWVNWLEIPLYLCSMIFTFVFATPCLCVYNWQWQIGVVAVFLGWIGLISFLQKWPVTGIYVLMFINIIQSFLKIAFLALLLVIAFALAFYMLFFEPDEMRNAFSHPGRAIVKVMTMTTGELDYDDLFHQQEGEDEIAFPPVTFILWIIFLVLIPVLLSNLLVGLAVGDVDKLQEAAAENRIELQIDLVLTIEEMLEFMHLRHRFVIKESEALYPNAMETLLPNWFKGSKTNEDLAEMAEDKYERPDKVRRWIAKRYAKWGISDDYSTSGVKICNRIENPQDPTEKQLAKLSHQLVKLQQQGDEQEKQLEGKLLKQGEEQKKQLEDKLQQLSEKSEEQAKEMKEQAAQLAGEVATLRKELETKLQQDFQEAIKQLSEKSEEQAAEMKAQTEQLAGEVATLSKALQKLITKMDV